jgi:hypothetical protein
VLILFLNNGDPKVSFTLPMTAFMFYYSFVFVLMRNTYSKTAISLRLIIMNFLLSFSYLSAFSIAGIMTPWWNF